MHYVDIEGQYQYFHSKDFNVLMLAIHGGLRAKVS